MICPDVFDNYIKLKNDNITNFNSSNLNKVIFDNHLYYYMENKKIVRLEKIKQYIDLGLDINANINKKKINWLELAVIVNDIPSIGVLIKNKVHIHRVDNDGLNIINRCAQRWVQQPDCTAKRSAVFLSSDFTALLAYCMKEIHHALII